MTQHLVTAKVLKVLKQQHPDLSFSCFFFLTRNPPTIQKLMRKPPTEEEERKHEEIKATLPEKQQVATDIIKEELRKRSKIIF